MPKKIEHFRGEYKFLSNFSPDPVRYQGSIYKTSEHAYQAAKTSSIEWHTNIKEAPTPQSAKFMGRRCPMKPNWDDIKVGVMLDIVRAKFSIERLSFYLLQTGDAVLEEGNNWQDTFWGVDYKLGGHNILGQILMHVREELRTGQGILFVPKLS